HSLFDSAGLGEGYSFSAVGYGLVRNLMGFVGFSGDVAQYGYAYRTVLRSPAPANPIDGEVGGFLSQGFKFGEAGSRPLGAVGAFGPLAINTTDVGLPVVRGNWLVRAHAVPEPSSSLTACAGAAVLLGFALWRAGGPRWLAHRFRQRGAGEQKTGTDRIPTV